MSFNWCEYYDLSKEIINFQCSVSNEARMRCGISRAYYAAHKSAVEYAQRNLYYTPWRNGRDHEKICQHLENNNMAKIANELRALRIIRDKSDYDKQMPRPDLRYGDALRFAKDILLALGHKVT